MDLLDGNFAQTSEWLLSLLFDENKVKEEQQLEDELVTTWDEWLERRYHAEQKGKRTKKGCPPYNLYFFSRTQQIGLQLKRNYKKL
jgi:hypothetical protein